MHRLMPAFYKITLINNDNWIPAPIELKNVLNVFAVHLLTHCADNEFQLSITLLLKTNVLVSKRNLLLNSFFHGLYVHHHLNQRTNLY